MSEAHGAAWQQQVRKLLDGCRIGFLATSGEHGPESSMAPYAADGGSILLHLSQLARHTSNIAAHPVAGLMICTPETANDSPLALPRLSLQGEVLAVPAEERDTARAAYLQVIPEAKELFGFADFALYRLQPARIHWVGGFGQARSIPPATWREITTQSV